MLVAGLLTTDLIMVRTLAMLGVTMTLLPLWSADQAQHAQQGAQQGQQQPAPGGIPPDALDSAAAVLASWVEGNPGFGGRLFQQASKQAVPA